MIKFFKIMFVKRIAQSLSLGRDIGFTLAPKKVKYGGAFRHGGIAPRHIFAPRRRRIHEARFVILNRRSRSVGNFQLVELLEFGVFKIVYSLPEAECIIGVSLVSSTTLTG